MLSDWLFEGRTSTNIGLTFRPLAEWDHLEDHLCCFAGSFELIWNNNEAKSRNCIASRGVKRSMSVD